jgi:ribonuclease P protein component
MSDNSFPKQARLRLRREYGYLMTRQQKAVGRHVVLLACPRRGGQPRLGIMISRKVSKCSPRRHQLKRWVRELFRCELQHRVETVDLLVLFRRDLVRDGHRMLDREIRALVDEAITAKPLWNKGRRGRGRKR